MVAEILGFVNGCFFGLWYGQAMACPYGGGGVSEISAEIFSTKICILGGINIKFSRKNDNHNH